MLDVLRRTLEKFYEKRPEDRFQDAAEADRALVACDEALRSAAVNTEAGLSGTMQRPQPVNVPDGASELGGFSATMRRPGSGASGTAITPGTPLPPRPITDRQPPAPWPVEGSSGPAPMPVPAPAPTPMPMPPPPGPPVQAQGSRNSGLLKGRPDRRGRLLRRGCIGLSILSSLFGMDANQSQEEEEDSSIHMQLYAPSGTGRLWRGPWHAAAGHG